MRENFAAAVVIPTILRPSLQQAVRSVFAQDLPARIQILIGVDIAEGDRTILAALQAECPAHRQITLVDPGYSTSVRHGGLHANCFSGALRTILTYLADSRHVAYLDDDNWFAPDHLSSLLAAGGDWAYGQRWFVSGDTPLCIDDWESVGPGAGVYAEQYGGFVDPSSLMIDKLACINVAPLWSLAPFADGSGEDRLVFEALRSQYRGVATGRATSYYRMQPRDAMHLERLKIIRQRGIVLPQDRAAGIISLAEALAAAGVNPPVVSAAAGTLVDDPLVADILRQLRPQEIILLGDGLPGDDILACAVNEALAPVVLAAGMTVLPAGAALASLPAAAGDCWSWLEAAPLAVDLCWVGRVTVGLDRALGVAWAVTRTGGLILGEGLTVDDETLRAAAERLGATLHDASLGDRARWMIQKDR